ncbi:hypothetical protein MPUL_00940 [Mycolicibacterium pulveris]|uniref:Resolvase HTH domain-containing protein n=1 Tax=Mycolicibacterium pulveris TaxID=36813 RepID=A0A7I7UFJ1_MYCPV|nr:helix-turn-helix domain-containing protein [Mycolicibacterium pulveris]BBY78936.1 hypothetical protein MPUL_00940 [Mycolicibacterium pulveris]
MRDRDREGEGLPGRKPALTRAQVVESQRLAAGESATRLAEFGVSRATVYNTRSRAVEGGQ